MVDCIYFGALALCTGDVVVIELTTRDVIRGVIVDVGKSKRFGFVSLAPECGVAPSEAVSIRRIVRVIKVGRCHGTN